MTPKRTHALIALAFLVSAVTAITATPVVAAGQMRALVHVASIGASQKSQATRIRFRRGRNSATVKGAIVRGSTGDEYVVGARAGQRLTLSITSLEKNAVFDLYKVRPEEPTEIVLEKQSWSGVLEEDGDYLIRVGSVRGNAGYTLRVLIR